MSVEVSRGNSGGIKGFVKKLTGQKPTLRVGFLQADIAKIATYNEFGVHIPVTDKMRGYFAYNFKINLKKDTTEIVIPARPFMQMTVDKNKDDWVKKMAVLARRFDYDITKVFEVMGDIIKGDIRAMLANGEFVENSKMTIANKGGKTRPLFDTGTLQDSIEYDVVKGW